MNSLSVADFEILIGYYQELLKRTMDDIKSYPITSYYFGRDGHRIPAPGHTYQELDYLIAKIRSLEAVQLPLTNEIFKLLTLHDINVLITSYEVQLRSAEYENEHIDRIYITRYGHKVPVKYHSRQELQYLTNKIISLKNIFG